MTAPRKGDAAEVVARFASETSGSLVTMFALVSTMVFAIAALAIDYLQLVRTRGALQQSLDSATIAAGIDKIQFDRDPAITLANYFGTNWKGKYGTDTPVATVDANEAERVATSATVNMPTTFAGVLGFRSIAISATSETRFGAGKTEVALTVDNTASMSGSKLTALTAAAKDMVDTAYATTAGQQNIKFSVVPFAQYVNVGTQYRSAPWLSVQNDGPQNMCYTTQDLISTSNCRDVTNTYYNDGVPYQATVTVCDAVYGPVYQVCKDYQMAWKGCVGSKAPPKDGEVDANMSSPVPGIMTEANGNWPSYSCNSPLLRLTNNQTDIRAKLDEFVATGETYIPSGLLWGWRTLSPIGPFADGSPATGPTRARKVLVLMTDGANTRSANAPYHEGYDSVDADNITKSMCASIKAEGIEIFTVAFEVTDANIKSILKDCASSDPFYFDAQNESQLAAAFKTMAASLGGVRLSR